LGALASDSHAARLPDADGAIRRERRLPLPSVRLFASVAGQDRVRRATDVLLFVPALIGLIALAAAQPAGTVEEALVEFLASFPGWLAPVWGLLLGATVLWLAVLLVASLVRRRWSIVVQAALAAVLAIAVAALASRIAGGEWPGVAAALGRHVHDPPFPAVRMSLAIAVLIMLNGHLVQPARRVSHWLLVLAAVGAAIGGTAGPSALAGAFLVGIVAAGGVRLALGSSAGLRSVPEVAAALSQLGIPAEELQLDTRQVDGVVTLHAGDGAGQRLTIKVYGRDAYDNQLLVKLWRTLMYRDSGRALGLGRSQAAEHEAFVTMLARNAGVAAPAVVTAGATVDGDAILVLRGGGETSLDELAPEAVTEAHLRSAWQSVSQLSDANIAHGNIDPSIILVAGDGIVLTEFGEATVTPTPAQLTCDRAQLLASTAAVVGTERALAAAIGAAGPDGVAAFLAYLQPAAFGPDLRRSLKTAGIDVDELRKQAETAVGATPAPLVKLRRVTWGAFAQAALLVFAASAVLSAAGGVDYDQLASDLQDASWSWIALGFVVAQLPRVAQSVATLGTVPIKLPFGPVYAMQLATGYLNLALPSGLARLAVNVRFFQRQGLPPATAVASGAIDSFANNVVQALLLVFLLVFSQASMTIDLGTPEDSGASHVLVLLLAILAVVVIGAVVTFVVSPRARQAVVGRWRRWWPQVRATLRSLRSGQKIAQLFLGNVAAEVLFATALGIFAHALGYDVSLADLLLINMSVSLLSSFIPVPGGIGVVEGGLMVGLAGVGIPEEAALAIALVYRVATFYLPPIAGWFAMRWLKRHSYL
jgi:uncharacterized protein (TIRG00374 family)